MQLPKHVTIGCAVDQLLDTKEWNGPFIVYYVVHHRTQYFMHCSTMTLPSTQESILYLIFYTMQYNKTFQLSTSGVIFETIQLIKPNSSDNTLYWNYFYSVRIQ